MSKIKDVAGEISNIEKNVAGESFLHGRHPLCVFVVSCIYIVCVMSFGFYELSALIPMILYPVIMFQLSGLYFRDFFYKLRFVMPILVLVGIWNPILDRIPVMKFGPFVLTTGIISFISLLIKGMLALMASYVLIATMGIEKICYALSLLKVPQVITSLVLMTYRYIGVLVSEADIMWDAYQLRAPNQKGVHFGVWGSFLGQLLIRSMDRSKEVYNGMLMRGYTGNYSYIQSKKVTFSDIVYMIVCISAFISFRIWNISILIGNMLG